MKRNLDDRPNFLKSLIKEYYTTKSLGAKKEVLANLANFAYNPVNYAFMRQLNVIDVFVDSLCDSDQDIVHFAVAGLCNLSADPENKTIISEKGGVERISQFLDYDNIETVVAAITCLIYLVCPSTIASITRKENIKIVLKLSKGDNKRLRNLAVVFLEDICSKEQILEATGRPVISRYLHRRRVTKIAVREGENFETTRKITDSDIVAYANLMGDRCSVPLKDDMKIVQGGLLTGLVSMAINTLMKDQKKVMLEQHVRFPKPCYPNEEIRVSAEIASTCGEYVNIDFLVTVPDQKKTVLFGTSRLVVN